jgi:hypothetical protein
MGEQMNTGLAQHALAAALACLLWTNTAVAQTEPLGGKPAPGSKPSVADPDCQVKYQRAFEAVLWSVPSVDLYGFLRGAKDLGVADNTILAWSKPARPNAELLTANNVTPYIFSFTDLRKGPAVVAIPAATDKASLYGQIVDHWQITIADVGPSGIDGGKGGKILLTPPGYQDPVPAGYIEVKSPSYRVAFALRSIKSATATTEDAYAYARTLKQTQYLFALADKDGKELQAGKTYKFTMPAKVPVTQFWSLIVYDLETFAFIYSPMERAGLASFDLPNMKKNPDGSTTLYFGPKAPEGLESNWIQTSGKAPLPVVRIYGGTEEFWNRSWEMPDVELVN